MFTLTLSPGEKAHIRAGVHLSLPQQLADATRDVINEYVRGNISIETRNVSLAVIGRIILKVGLEYNGRPVDSLLRMWSALQFQVPLLEESSEVVSAITSQTGAYFNSDGDIVRKVA